MLYYNPHTRQRYLYTYYNYNRSPCSEFKDPKYRMSHNHCRKFIHGISIDSKTLPPVVTTRVLPDSTCHIINTNFQCHDIKHSLFLHTKEQITIYYKGGDFERNYFSSLLSSLSLSFPVHLQDLGKFDTASFIPLPTEINPCSKTHHNNLVKSFWTRHCAQFEVFGFLRYFLSPSYAPANSPIQIITTKKTYNLTKST